MKKLVLFAAVMLFGGGVYAAEADPTGQWSVKSTVSMNSCQGVKISRVTSEQWIINQNNTEYQIQVVGNVNTQLIYTADFASDGSQGYVIGRYNDAKGMTKKGFSDVMLAFSEGSMRGMRVDVSLGGNGCSTTSALELKKMN